MNEAVSCKKNKVLFLISAIVGTIRYAVVTVIGTILWLYLTSFFAQNHSSGIRFFSILFCILLITWKIVHLILLRKAQWYIIGPDHIIKKGGFLNKFEHVIQIRDIKSVNFTQNLIQQLLGTGTLVIAGPATDTGTITLVNLDQVKRHFNFIRENQNKGR